MKQGNRHHHIDEKVNEDGNIKYARIDFDLSNSMTDVSVCGPVKDREW